MHPLHIIYLRIPHASSMSTLFRGEPPVQRAWNPLLGCLVVLSLCFVGCLSKTPCMEAIDRVEYPYAILEDAEGNFTPVLLAEVTPDTLNNDSCVRERRKTNKRRYNRLLSPIRGQVTKTPFDWWDTESAGHESPE